VGARRKCTPASQPIKYLFYHFYSFYPFYRRGAPFIAAQQLYRRAATRAKVEKFFEKMRKMTKKYVFLAGLSFFVYLCIPFKTNYSLKLINKQPC
jgi:hypothetical protein